MMVLATLMRFSKLWFSQFWNCILPLRGGLGGANASFTSFLRAEEKENLPSSAYEEIGLISNRLVT